MAQTSDSAEDRSLFGEGPYPDAGPLAVLARVAFVAAVLAIVVAVFLPRSMVPQFTHSHYLEHFAAFYVATLFGAAALPRMPFRRMGISYVVLAALLEASHLLAGAPLWPLVDNWVADVGGMTAAIAPAFVERFRRRFARGASGRGLEAGTRGRN